jgi:hypothetical protein
MVFNLHQSNATAASKFPECSIPDQTLALTSAMHRLTIDNPRTTFCHDPGQALHIPLNAKW